MDLQWFALPKIIALAIDEAERDPQKESIISSLLKRGPAFCALSWLWPISTFRTSPGSGSVIYGVDCTKRVKLPRGNQIVGWKGGRTPTRAFARWEIRRYCRAVERLPFVELIFLGSMPHDFNAQGLGPYLINFTLPSSFRDELLRMPGLIKRHT